MPRTEPISLADWLQLIESRHPQGADGIDLGLVRTQQVKERLAQCEQVPVILVGGTNGKGSTCAMLDAILRSAGYRVGRYASPHLLRYNERIRIAGVPVGDVPLLAAFARVEAARGEIPLTYFEFGTLAAWEVFSADKVDVVILEVGLGGRLDATNVYRPSCSVVTTVDIDHVEWLGGDRESIGREKAGIFHPGIPAICGDPLPPRSLLDVAARVAAPLQVAGRDFGYQRQDRQWRYWGQGTPRNALAFPGLRGRHQLANAATVLATLDALADVLPVAMQDIRHGLLAAEVAGRFQVLPGRPTIVLDVAHNAQSMRALASNLGDMAFYPRTFGVFGMLADKDSDAAIAALRERIDHWLVCTLPGRRGMTAQALAACLGAQGIDAVECFDTPAQALAHAQEKADEADRIIAFGSFLTVAAALEFLGRAA